MDLAGKIERRLYFSNVLVSYLVASTSLSHREIETDTAVSKRRWLSEVEATYMQQQLSFSSVRFF